MKHSLTREYIEVLITDFDDIWHKYNFQKNRIFLLIVDVEGVEITLKVGDAEHISSNISKTTEDTIFL